MKHLRTYKIFESNEENFCDSYYKRFDDLKKTYKLEKEKIIEEYVDIINDCMRDLTDEFEFKFEISPDSLRCHYVFDFDPNKYNGKWDKEKGCSLWKSDLDKFEEESNSIISRFESMNIPHKVRGVHIKADENRTVSLDTIRSKEHRSNIVFSIGD